jgi:hypothetical protein
MARKTKQDVAKAKAAKQKKIAIGGAVVLVALLAIEVPKTMKMLNQTPAPPIVSSTTGTTTTPATVTPSDPNTLAAPTLAGTPTTTTTAAPAAGSQLVDAVPVSADNGQIAAFQKMASKDPFAVQVNPNAASTSGGSKSSSGSSTRGSGGAATTPSTPATTPPSTPSAPTAPARPTSPAPTSAVISLNGELMSVSAGGDFPTSGTTFSRVGTLFHLVSLTAKTAKISVAGGSYADGAPTVTLHLGTPLTLQNTADGSKYTLILEPPNTQVSGAAPTGGATTTPTPAPTTTTGSVVAGSGG